MDPDFTGFGFCGRCPSVFALDSTKLRLQNVLLSVTLTFDLLLMTVVCLLSYKLLCPKAIFCLSSVCDLSGLKEKLWEKKRTLHFISDNLKISEKKMKMK